MEIQTQITNEKSESKGKLEMNEMEADEFKEHKIHNYFMLLEGCESLYLRCLQTFKDQLGHYFSTKRSTN